MKSCGRVAFTCVAAAFAMQAGTRAQPSTLPPDIAWVLQQKPPFTDADATALLSGQVIVHANASAERLEAGAIAAVRIRTPKDRAVDYFRQLISYEDGEVTLGFGTFGRPPRDADAARLTLDRDDVGDLRGCRPGRCAVRIGAAGAAAIASAIDFRAPDAAARASAWARERLASYAAAYLERGDAALVVYDDRSEPVDLRTEWRGIVESSPALAQYAPALQRYLVDFPKATLPGATDEIYWDKQHYTSLKPVIGVTHMVTWRDPARPDRALVAQKQIYASHYFDGSLAVTLLLQDPKDVNPPFTYVVYFNRSRGDLLKGGFGGLKRRVAEEAATKSAQDTLGAMKRALEQ